MLFSESFLKYIPDNENSLPLNSNSIFQDESSVGFSRYKSQIAFQPKNDLWIESSKGFANLTMHSNSFSDTTENLYSVSKKKKKKNKDESKLKTRKIDHIFSYLKKSTCFAEKSVFEDKNKISLQEIATNFNTKTLTSDSEYNLENNKCITNPSKKNRKPKKKMHSNENDKREKNISFGFQSDSENIEEPETRKKYIESIMQEFKSEPLSEFQAQEMDSISRIFKETNYKFENPVIVAHFDGGITSWKTFTNFKNASIKFTYVGVIWKVPLNTSINLQVLCNKIEKSLRARSSTKRDKRLFAIASKIECDGFKFIVGYLSAPYAFTANQWNRLLADCTNIMEMPVAYAFFSKQKPTFALNISKVNNGIEFVHPIFFNVDQSNFSLMSQSEHGSLQFKEINTKDFDLTLGKKKELEEFDLEVKVPTRKSKRILKTNKKTVLSSKKSIEFETDCVDIGKETIKIGSNEVISLCHSENSRVISDFCEDN